MNIPQKQISYMAIPSISISAVKGHVRRSDNVVELFCKANDIELDWLIQKRRQWRIVKYRQALAYYLRKLTDMSLSEIADIFGQDHTTVMHALKTVSDRMETDPDYVLWLQSVSPYPTIVRK